MEQRGSEVRCTAPILPSTLGDICNVHLQLRYPKWLHNFFMSKITCSTPSWLTFPKQADPEQTHQPKPPPCPVLYDAQTGLKSTISYNLLRIRNRYTPSIPSLHVMLSTDNHHLPFSCCSEPEIRDTSQLLNFTRGYSRYLFAIDARVPQITQTKAYHFLQVKGQPSLEKNISPPITDEQVATIL